MPPQHQSVRLHGAGFLHSQPYRQGNSFTEHFMSLCLPETGRITLTLTSSTIKALRMLALLKGENHNQVAENLLIAGGLHKAVDTEWSTEMPGRPEPTETAPVSQVPLTSEPVSEPEPEPISTEPPAPVDYKRDWMPEVRKVNDNSEVSPYLKDEAHW